MKADMLLHIFLVARQNIFMKYAVIFIILSVIIIPLPFSVKGIFSFYNKKTYFNLYFFGFIKIKSTYINYNEKKFYLHLTDKKAVEFKPRDMMPQMDNIDVFELFAFTKIRYALVLNAADNVTKFIAISLVNQMNFIMFSVLREIKPSLDFGGSSIVCDDEKSNGVYFDVGICFSILKIIAGIIKSFLKGVKNA